MKKYSIYSFFAGMLLIAMASCKKNNLVVDQDIVPPSYAKFNTLNAADTIGNYLIRSTNNAYKIPVGITTVSDKDRTIQISYTSRTAVQGVQYTAPTSITIPAGKALDTLTIQGLFAGYTTTTRVDTVKVTIGGGDVPANAYKNTFYVIMRKYCDVVFSGFAGNYTRTNELWGTSAYGPYTTAISSITSTGPTSARISVSNIYDYGWAPIEFNVSWANPTNHTVTVIDKSSGIADAGTLSATYAGQQVAVRSFAGTTGTFNSCDQTVTLRFQLGVAGVGWFNSLYTVTMVR